MRFVISSYLVILLSACSNESANSCKVTCTQDSDCPSGQTCGGLDRCTGGDQCACTAGEFLGCADQDTALFCSPEGTGFASEPCNTFGCEQAAGRCNECVADQLACRQDDTMVETCGPDALVASTEVCAAGCVDTPSDVARCRHIIPVWIPASLCEAPSPRPMQVLGGATISTGPMNAICDEVITQTLPSGMPTGPEICVIRAGKLEIGDLKVIGSRAIALVADSALDVIGLVDVSADGALSGPGGGYQVSGASETSFGGGGAGFKQVGARGGNGEFGGGGAGGGTVDPLSRTSFMGGPRPAEEAIFVDKYNPVPGGGGGALMLVSCHGTITVSGAIDAGGGGGQGGGDRLTSGTQLAGGGGGGAGGYVVLQGAQVLVTGRVFANGGGGGGSCSADNCVAPNGQDGSGEAGSTGAGGSFQGTGTSGGNGGVGGAVPTNGGNAMFEPTGGGGGSTGRIQVYTAEGVSPVLMPMMIEPAFEPNLTVRAR